MTLLDAPKFDQELAQAPPGVALYGALGLLFLLFARFSGFSSLAGR